MTNQRSNGNGNGNGNDNHVETCQHKRVGRLLLILALLLVLGGFSPFLNRNNVPLHSTTVVSEPSLKEKASWANGIHQDGAATAGGGSFFYDRLEECIPCSAQEEQLLGNYVPSLIIPGAQKSGTTFMHNMLRQHPNVSKLRQESRILDENPVVQGNSIHQCQVWEAYRQLYDTCKDCQAQPTNFNLDKTPAYLFLSHLVPARMACAFPKPVKLLILLRNPTDRAFSQYQMMFRSQKHFLTGSPGEFFERIVRERNALQEIGVAPGLERREGFMAWKRFHNHRAGGALLSRGLYALQLAHWIDTLSELWGLSRQELVQEYFFIVDNDDVKADPQAVLDRILVFAGLTPFQFDLDVHGKGSDVHNCTALTNEEREYMDEFYLPFNVDLHHFLAPYGIEIGFAKRAAIEFE